MEIIEKGGNSHAGKDTERRPEDALYPPGHKGSILKLLEEKEYPKITVTEICRLAEINRGTFYLHYYDTADVLDDLLSEILKETTSVIDHVFCPARASGNCSYPFCDRLHSSDRYQALFLDDTISAQIIEKNGGNDKRRLCDLADVTQSPYL